jgi:hypothetical protein
LRFCSSISTLDGLQPHLALYRLRQPLRLGKQRLAERYSLLCKPLTAAQMAGHTRLGEIAGQRLPLHGPFEGGFNFLPPLGPLAMLHAVICRRARH